MSKPIEFTYECEICHKVFKSKNEQTASRMAKQCEQNHDTKLVPLTTHQIQDLMSLMMAVRFTELEAFCDESCYKILRQYSRPTQT